MNIDYSGLSKNVIGKKIPKPLSGTLSGHAAGEPFDKFVYEELKLKYPKNTFRQYEYLNDLYTSNPKIIGFEGRSKLFNSPSVLFLLSRGKNATDKWSIDNPFEEKQNDTADILVTQGECFNIIDIKTRNLSKAAQPPNIISAFKLAQLCAKMLDNEDFDTISIDYFELDWILKKDFLECVATHHACLFKTDPNNLYINWAAAMQIQFHVADVDQSFAGDKKMWAKTYLKHFVKQAKKRAEDMIVKFVVPFEQYIN